MSALDMPSSMPDAAGLRLGGRRLVVVLIGFILAYPAALGLFHKAGRLAVEAEAAPVRALGWAGTIVFLALAFSLPFFAFRIARLRAVQPLSAQDLFVRRVAHLAFAAPPLYTATGVYLFTFDAPGLDPYVWTGAWIVVLGLLLARGPNSAAEKKTRSGDPPAWLRWTHGLGAAALLVLFLAGHLANHLAGLLGYETHRAVMDLLRLWYRSSLIEPILVAGFSLMIGTGLTLARHRTISYTDALGTLQTLTGAYLAAFLFSHMTAVFVLARWKSGTETDWLYATSAPTGLFADAWSVRLIPHYTFAVAFVVAHAACGLRVVLLAHGASDRDASRIAWTIAAGGAIFALAIVAGMLGLRIA